MSLSKGLLVIALVCSLTSVAAAQGEESLLPSQTKQQRLKVAGWTLIAAGLAFPVIAVPIAVTKDESCSVLCKSQLAGLISVTVGPLMLLTGTVLLARRRRIRRNTITSVSFSPGLRGLVVQGEF